MKMTRDEVDGLRAGSMAMAVKAPVMREMLLEMMAEVERLRDERDDWEAQWQRVNRKCENALKELQGND